jgi:hypothetical protein
MNAELRLRVIARAEGRCEYCRLSQDRIPLAFHVEHITPRQHGGQTEMENLALACGHCNQHKGPNLSGIDPDSGDLCRLYHPRREEWSVHMRRAGKLIMGITAMGRTTVWVLNMNSELQKERRSKDLRE